MSQYCYLYSKKKLISTFIQKKKKESNITNHVNGNVYILKICKAMLLRFQKEKWHEYDRK